MADLSDPIYLAALAPGARFVRVGAPHFVWIKTSHTWAHAFWKGRRHDAPMHPCTLVRRAPAGKVNPGETAG